MKNEAPQHSAVPVPSPSLSPAKTFRDWLIVLRERFWAGLFAGLLVAVPVAFFQAREEPVFVTSATIQFERPEKIVQIERVVETDVRSDVDLNTYLQILSSAQVRQRVVDSFTREETAVIKRFRLARLDPGEEPPSLAAAMGSGLAIESVRNSLLVRVSYRHPDPEAAALLANRYVEEFIRFLLERSMAGNVGAVEFLQERAAGMRREMEEARLKVQRYRQNQNLVSLEENQNIVGDRLKTLHTALTRARLDRIALEVIVEQIEKAREERRDPAEVQYIAEFGSVPVLKTRLDELLKERDLLADRYLERHPAMIDMENSISATRQQLERNIAAAISELMERVRTARSTELTLQGELTEAEREAFRLDELAVQFRVLEDEARVLQSNYQAILDRLNQTSTTQAIDTINVRMLDPAWVPGRPVSPDLWKILQFAGLLGLAFFVAVPFGLNMLDDRIKSSGDLEEVLGIHLAGVIPLLPELNRIDRGGRSPLASSPAGEEAFLGLYSALKLRSQHTPPKSILVTSTVPGEGKTLIISGLAGRFARHGLRTLLIDTDLRRPTQHRVFDLPNDAGILHWYDFAGAAPGEDPAEDAALGIAEVSENLSLLRAGGRSKSPSRVLEDPKFDALVRALGRRYDVLLFDSPPLGPVSDGFLLAGKVDEVVYVCRFNSAQRRHARMLIDRLRESGADILGGVLNGLNERRIQYYSNYRYYRSYKKYYVEA